MDFYERIAEAFDRLEVNRAQVGRDTGMSGQAVTQKLKRKSAVTPHEIAVYAKYAGMPVSKALGEMDLVIELRDEQDVVTLYRMMDAEQKKRWVGIGMSVVGIDVIPSELPAPPE